MHPILTTLQLGERAIPIGGYGALLALALLVGSGLALRSAAQLQLDVGAFIAALAAAIGSGLFGGSLLFALLGWLQTGSLVPPGLVFYGAAIVGTLGFALTARAHGLPLATALDASLPALPLAHAIGRLGCLLGGCCYGARFTGPWAIVYTHPLAPAAHPTWPRHPWPLYEALVLLVLAAFFASRWAPPAGSGRRSALYVLCYALARSALEPLRGDAIRGVAWGGLLSTSQLISLGLGLGALTFLVRSRSRGAPRSFALHRPEM
jgi:phosphatidylglycerol---prolipoprotein diacylglyceryl transferase